MSENERMNINQITEQGYTLEEAVRIQKRIREMAKRRKPDAVTEEVMTSIIRALKIPGKQESLKELMKYWTAVMIPPIELKQMIKREKNPLRKKQLEKELNEAYRKIKKRRKKNVKKERPM